MKTAVYQNQDPVIRTELLDVLRPYLERYGKTELAYSSLQRGMSYFFVDSLGFIAFDTAGTFRKNVLVLSDPIASANDQQKLTELFFDKFKNVTFWQTHEPYARLLHDGFGYYANQFGVVTDLDLMTYDIKGERKQPIRSALNLAKKANIAISEVNIAELPNLDQLTDAYIAKKRVSTGELRFLARELVTEPEWNVRVFAATKDGKTVGIAVYDPMFSEGKIIGYVSDILRCTPEATPGLAHALDMHAFDVFKSEAEKDATQRSELKTLLQEHKKERLQQRNAETKEVPRKSDAEIDLETRLETLNALKTLNLGLSPYAHIHDDLDINNPLTTIILQATFQIGNSLYNSKGLALHKKAYQGREYPVFMSSKKKISLFELMNMYATSNVSIPRQILKAIIG